MLRAWRRLDVRIYLVAALTALTAIAAAVHGAGNVLPQTALAVAAACLIDVTIRSDGRFPVGALISGLIVALLLPEGQRWYVPLVAAAVAIGSKHVVRWRGRHLFNPAAAGVAAGVFLFGDQLQYGHADYLEAGPRLYYAQGHLRMEGWGFLVQGGHGWTGSVSALAVAILGVALVIRIKKGRLVTAYLATYLLAVSAFAVVAGQDVVVRLLLEVFATGVPFFAFFMLTDPATSPRGDPASFGAATALLSFLCRLVVSPVLFLLLALLVANLALAIPRSTVGRAAMVGRRRAA